MADITSRLWRKEFGVLKLDQMRWLKDMELTNSRLSQPGSEPALDRFKLTEALSGKANSPSHYQPAVQQVGSKFGISERRGCQVICQPRSKQRRALRLAIVEDGLTAAVTVRAS